MPKKMKSASKKKSSKVAVTKPKKTAAKAPKVTPQKTLKLTVPKAPYKKSEFFQILAEQTELNKKDIKKVIETLQTVIKLHLVKNGPGQFTLPGMFKVITTIKPATKARKGKNPFTGEEMIFKAKPAKRVVKVRVLKKFKTELE
jgi:nucleoid DNA-binding protein